MKRVLVAEDDESMRALLVETLKEAGYEVDAHEDGASAWEAAKSGGQELAVLDVNLPGVDGLELCRRLRKRAGKTAVLMLTVRSGVDDQIRGYFKGADDYLSKPFAPEVLVARLKTLERRVLSK